jgi:hypothetical protein
MAGPTKTVEAKLKTKIKNIVKGYVVEIDGTVQFNGTVLFSFDENTVKYGLNRYFPSQIDSLSEDDFKVTIPLNHVNLKYISTSNANPPKFAYGVVKMFRDHDNTIEHIVIGASENNIDDTTLNITSQLYEDFVKINSEEAKIKASSYKNRLRPFLSENFGIEYDEEEIDRDYGVLLREVINSGQITQDDIISLTQELEFGDSANVVIEKQVNKQVKWLIDTIELILEIENFTKPKAKDFGNEHFKFTKVSITGPEHLMEMILEKYGQFTLFGVPALLNTDKYVVHERNLSRSQFDLILINHLGDVEVVELKRSDEILLDFDSNRKKFYPSKTLSIGIAQSERYISAVLKSNDEDYTIHGKKIGEYLNDELGGVITIDAVRPSALVIIGSDRTIYKSYNDLSLSVQGKITRQAYNDNGDMAFKELKGTYRNIKILTYSELLTNARTRLELFKEQE